MSSKNESIAELVREINQLKEMQKEMFREMISLLKQIKVVAASAPFVDRERVHFLTREDATLSCQTIVKNCE